MVYSRKSIPCCDDFLTGGRKPLDYYEAPIYQVGHGFLSNMFSKVIPLLADKFGPYLGRRAMETGRDLMGEIREGSSLKQALKRSSKRALQTTKEDVLRKLKGGRRKRKTIKKKSRVVDFLS